MLDMQGITEDIFLTDRQTDRQYLPQFQGLRAVAFGAIFISHLGIGNLGALGAWGVSVFLVLSGFLMVNSYWLKEKQPVFGVAFAYQKIKRLYPLHIATMLCAALLRVYSILIGNETYPKLLLDIALHSVLIQIWIPNGRYYSTLNGVSWYLCACAFAYFCFPIILKKIRKADSRKKVLGWLTCLIIMEILISGLASFIGNPEQNAFLSVQWMTYYCPLSRLVDFSIGCCIGYLYIHRTESGKTRHIYSLFEGIVCAMIVLSWYVYANRIIPLGGESVRYSLLFIGSTSALIWLIAVNRGVLATILSNQLLCWIGGISPYAFLIHSVVIKYVQVVLNDLRILNGFTLFLLSVALTVCASVIWMKLESANFKRKKKDKRFV